MTNQELFNKVYLGLARQDFTPSVGPDGTCRYRGPGRLQCAAGYLIEDAHYDEALEGHSSEEARVEQALLASGVEREQLQLVSDLQCAHDYAAHSAGPGRLPVSLQDKVAAVGQDWGLVVPEVADQGGE